VPNVRCHTRRAVHRASNRTFANAVLPVPYELQVSARLRSDHSDDGQLNT
jgi:hypothetical protein